MKDNHKENSNTTVVIEDTQVSSEQQQRNSDYDIATFIEKFRSSLDLTEKRFLKIEDHLIGLSYIQNLQSILILGTLQTTTFTLVY